MPQAKGIDKAREYLAELESKYERLIQMEPIKVGGKLPSDVPMRAVYLFSEGADFLYVGRTKNLKSRLQMHYRPSSDSSAASFAFLLARDKTQKMTRAARRADHDFGEKFKDAKDRISKMDLRYIEETDPNAQALLEVFVAIATLAKHNSFETH